MKKQFSSILLSAIAGFLLLTGCTAGKRSVKPETVKGYAKPNARAWQYFTRGMWDEFEYRYEDALLNYYKASYFDSTNTAIYMAIAENEIKLEVYDVALLFLNKALKLSPNDPTILSRKAQTLTRMDKYREAYDIYKRLLMDDPLNPVYLYWAGNLIDVAKLKDQEEWYYTFVAENTDETESWLDLAKYYFSNEKLASAREVLEKLHQREPLNQEVTMTLAECYYYCGEYDAAVNVLRSLVTEESNLALIYKIVDLYNKAEKYGDAAKFVEKYMEDGHKEGQLYMILADMYLRADNSKEAAKILADYKRELFEDKSPYYYELAGRTYLDMFRKDSSATQYVDSAITVLDEGVKEAGNEITMWLLNIYARVEAKKYRQAILQLQKAEPRFPDSKELLVLHMQILAMMEKQDEMIPVAERILSIDEKDENALAFLSGIYQEKENYAKSDSLYVQALRYYPDRPVFLNNYAYSLAVRNMKLDKALELVSRALEKEPKNPAYLDTKGWILYKRNNLLKAKELILRAYEIIGEDKEILEHLGDVMWKLGDKEKAVEYWKKALELDVENAVLKNKVENGLEN